jgi:hypothetical protein
MINVGSPNAVISTGSSYVQWQQTASLDDVITASFPLDQPSWKAKRSRWSKDLHAYSLERIGGFEIVWTSNLADHLIFDEDLERISLYHHARVLQGHQSALPNEYVHWQLHSMEDIYYDTCTDSGFSQVLPEDLLNETLLTLALLLPRANKGCRRWFEKSQKRCLGTIDEAAAEQLLVHQGRLLSKYNYLHDRLVIIVEAFDKAEPKGVSQWWTDRRKRVQWFTFWIASVVLLLTIIFGLIQSITGILQVYAAYRHPRSI